MSFLKKMSGKLADFLGESSEFESLSKEKEFSFDLIDHSYLAELLHYRLFDSDLKVYENKSGFGFVLEAIPLMGASEEIQSELSTLVREIGEEGASIQCLLFADPRIGPFMEAWASQRGGEIYSKIAKKKREFFEEQTKEGAVPPRIFRFIFSYSQPKRGDLSSLIHKIGEKKKRALETFSRVSKAIEMEPDHLIDLLSGIVNFEMSDRRKNAWDRNNWISQQICLPGSAVEVGKEGLRFHGQSSAAFRTYETLEIPERWSLAHTGELIGDFLNPSYRIPSPFYLHYGIYFPSQEKAETRFKGKLKVLEHQSKFPYLVRMFPGMPKELEENLFVRQKLLEGEKFVETRLSCGIWAEGESFVKSESTLLALFQKHGFKLKENDFIHLPEFLSSLPMAWGEDSSSIEGLKRVRCMRTTITHETANLIPFVAEWWGNSNSGMVVTGRKGQIAAWDPFATEGNLNSIVIGPSGSGKSVFMQEMIMNHLGCGGRVFVLDLGRSFEKLCNLLGGQFLAFSEKCRFDLNPFGSIRQEAGVEALNAGLEMVSAIAATMAVPMQKIDKERADILSTLVKTAWEKEGERASVDTMIRMIDEMKFNSELMIGATESIKEGLKKYGRNGVYANYFFGENKVDFTSDFVVIETEELKNMGDLQSVILQMFTLAITSQIFMGDRGRRCLICIDEAWDLLKSPQMEGFIESLARRLRKYNGALVVGTQSVKDFDRSFGARAAFQNSNWLVMLGKDNDSINAIKKENLIPMNEYKERVLSSLRMERGQYSEFFLYHKGSGASSVCQLKLDPFSELLYSTKADEFQAVQELKDRGLSIEEALEWLLANRESFKQALEKGLSPREAIRRIS
jgi:conjugal transfer ATP-binding protein TraC